MNALTTFTDAIEAASKQVVRNAKYDLDAVANLREFNERQSSKDPSRLAWPATLPIELALRTASPAELKEHYEYDDETWMALRDHPAFIADLHKACELVKQEGMSFKLKCQLQAEGMLETNWKMVHASNNEVPPAVKARLMEATWRMAGYDNKSDGNGGGGANFAIQINLR